MSLLSIQDLTVTYGRGSSARTALHGVSLEVGRGERVAIVGESGSGKSTTAHAVLRLLPAAADLTGGTVRLSGAADGSGDLDLVTATDRQVRSVRGVRIGFVPQDPTVSLNPVTRIGTQVAEVLRIHGLATGAEARERAVEELRRAGIDRPELRARQYPHELSGGMRQRVLIAIALIGDPELLVADEPTSALDVTVQRTILDHLDRLVAERGTSVLFITHDLGVAADRADRIVVMSEGRIVEQGTPAEVLGAPREPYTRALIAAAPSLDDVTVSVGRATGLPADGDPLVVATGLRKSFDRVTAVDGVDVTVPRGRTLALVGESGSGKSTTARLVLGLERPDAGSVRFDGADVGGARGAALRAYRRQAQIVQQNPYAALHPRLSVGAVIADPLAAFGIGTRRSRTARAAELLDLVALPSSVLGRRPAELSGGQRQRVAIARALALDPSFIVLDEPVSALDVSVQAQILDLLAELQSTLGVSYLFISHDLAVVRRIAHEVSVLRGGRVVEHGDVAQVLHDPQHEYTRALLDAIPGRSRRVPTTEGVS
ncbi:peptide/nickel transport system ATP-binding protein [Curtobacterium sp. PhB142]|uniref:dipeptide ABC transporter ATP-binding protein n=1 Tax=unclassified Curtobacterium TaxID=257496 RepID=UPI00104430E6|nr:MULTISPECIES: ABC transporter ATP-binding protein [unclassified Curtobacterium]TCL85033.1 peptide/nickel transport system ATP-binding protein [Curtobacterium sp. PhB142]TCM02036.1 peptide/nickel transport system ATP-binding protein [Curtobacterium sp. PhB134]